MDVELWLKLAEKVGPWTALFVGLAVHHWRRRKGARVSPADMGRVYERLGRVLQRVDDLFAELADNESASRERHKDTMEELDRVRRAAEKRLSA